MGNFVVLKARNDRIVNEPLCCWVESICTSAKHPVKPTCNLESFPRKLTNWITFDVVYLHIRRLRNAGTTTEGFHCSKKDGQKDTLLTTLYRSSPNIVKYAKCSRQPLKGRENASFLIDVKWVENWESLKGNMNGVYDGVLRCAVWTIEMDNGS